MRGFTKGKGKGKKFIPTSRKKSGLQKSDISAEKVNKILYLDDTNDNKVLMLKGMFEKRDKQSLDEGKYDIKCDDCNKTTGHTDSMKESAQGSKCDSCKAKIKAGDDPRAKESLDKPMSYNDKKDDVFAKIKKAGFTIHEEREEADPDERDEDDDEDFVSHRFEISEAKMLSVMDGTKTAGEMIDELTDTTTDERLRFDIDSGNPLHIMQQEGKAHVDSSNHWKKGKE